MGDEMKGYEASHPGAGDTASLNRRLHTSAPPITQPARAGRVLSRAGALAGNGGAGARLRSDMDASRHMKGNHPMADPKIIEYTAKVAAFSALLGRILPENRGVLFEALDASGIAKVVVRFDGQGGCGQIESVDAYAAHGSATGLPATDIAMLEAVFDGPGIAIEKRSLRGSVEIMSYTLIEQSHRTWSAGDGAYGDLTFNVDSRSIRLRYNKRIMTSVRSTRWF